MDVVDVWSARQAGALLKALRLTNEGFAERLGVAVRTVAKWNANPGLEPTPDIQQALDTLLARAPEDARARFTLLTRASGTRADTGKTASPIEEAEQLIAEISGSSTTDSAIRQLDEATKALSETHTRAPARRLLREALRLNSQARELMTHQQRLSQRRELFRIESNILAHVCLLFGDLDKNDLAEKWGTASLGFAQEAGISEAIPRTALAKTLRWADRLIESAEMARLGYEASPNAPVRIQLASQEANAAGLLGDRKRAQDALTRAERAAAEAPVDSGVSAWSFPTGRQAIFALSVATEIGDAKAALRAAEVADSGWAAGEPKVLANWAQIRVGAAMAHLANDSLDGTIEEVTPVFALTPEFRVSTVTAYMARLCRRLDQARFDGSGAAADLQASILEFNRAALPD